MTNLLSDEDKKKMFDVLRETPEEAIKRMRFWDSQPKPEYKAWPPNKAVELDVCSCRFSDPWRCAVDKRLSTAICSCKCHKHRSL